VVAGADGGVVSIYKNEILRVRHWVERCATRASQLRTPADMLDWKDEWARSSGGRAMPF
jgi:hypothetical protein